MSSPESDYLPWLEYAEEDFLNIENNLASERVPWGSVCFHAQQAGEKLLKALLLSRDQPPTRLHDLVALLERCVAIEPRLAEIEDDCRLLSLYAISARYPDMPARLEREPALAAVAAMRRVRERVLALLPAGPSSAR